MLTYEQRTVATVNQIDFQSLFEFNNQFIRGKSISSDSPFQQALASTVLISEDRMTPHGSGIVVNYNGRKYLATATHVLEDKAFGERTSLKVFERNGDIREIERMPMLYSAPLAYERGLAAIDIGLLLYDGNLEGVEVVTSVQPGAYRTVAIGYPGSHVAVWNKDLDPLVSPGQAYVPEKPELSPYMQKFLKQRDLLNAPESIQPILFSGAISRGNSGGGLYNVSGELLGICSAPQGTFEHETGLFKFCPILKILETIK